MNIKLITFIVLGILSSQGFALEVGNGSDGVCNFSGALNTTTKATYNCTSLSISSPVTVTGSNPLKIYVAK